MRKKALALTLAAGMALSLAACGSSTSTASSATESTAASTADSTEEAEPAASDVAWPTGTVTVEVAAAAGGGTDTLCRIMTNYLQGATGEAFTVVDDSTGNGTVAYETVRNADPDGYTLLFYHSTMPIQYYQGMYDYDPADPDNFTVVANVLNDTDAEILCVPGDAPYDTLEEFVAYCEEHPGEITFGNQNGGFGQLEALLFEDRAGIDINFVDAGGQADAIIALLGGNTDACFISSDAAKQYQESGDMKCLAICGAVRSSSNLPDVPTMQELGYDVVFNSCIVVLGPAGMDADLVEKINEVIGGAASDEDTIASLANLGTGYTHKTVEESRQIWQDHCATVKEVCALAGFDVSDK